MQNNLGAALGRLGSREEGTTHLLESVAACRAALEVRTRERVPLDWALTQNNLAETLETLGGRESGTERLSEAAVVYRAALDVFETSGASYFANAAKEGLASTERQLRQRRQAVD